MSKASIEKQIIDRLQYLEEAEQLEVLNFANSLAKSNKISVSGKSLLKFVGSISKEDLEIMSDTIDRECGKIDLDEW